MRGYTRKRTRFGGERRSIREKKSNTWKGFLEEAAVKLGLEETKKCGFFEKRERWIVCQLCWQIKE